MQNFKNLILLTFVVVGILACSSKSDKELYEEAQVQIKQDNFAEGLENLESILKDFPQSELAPKVKLEIGQIYHAKKIKNLSARESYQMAIKYYRMAYDDHPKSENGPNSLFMVAYIQANELGEVKAAETTYREFIEKCPDHELVASAKVELENLGMKPEEILKKKVQKTD